MMKKYYNTGSKGNYQAITDGCFFVSPKESQKAFISLIYPFSPDVKIRDINNEPGQYLIFKYNKTNNSYSIMFLHTYQYLSVEKKEDSNYNDSLVIMHSKGKNFLKEWIISSTEDQYYIFELKGTNLVLHYDFDSQNLILQEKRETDLQKFQVKLNKQRLVIPDSGFQTFKIIPKFTNLQKDKNEDQIYYIKFDSSDGCYSIINSSNGLCLSTKKNSTKLIESEFFNYDHQKWIILPIKQGEYSIIHKESLFKLDYSNQRNPINVTNFQLKIFTSSSIQSIYQLFNIKYANKKTENNLDLNKIREREKFRYVNEYVVESTKRKINDDFFSNKTMLGNLEIPLSTTEISENAFANCLNIKIIKCDPKWLHLFPNPLNIENIIVPNGVTNIEGDPFAIFSNLKLLELPQSLSINNCNPNIFTTMTNIVEYHGDPMFLKWIPTQLLTKVEIPSFVQIIPKETFMDCFYLSEVFIPQNSALQVIEERAFANCKLLKKISIPASVHNIAPDAFYGYNIEFAPELSEDLKMTMIDNLSIDPNVTIINDEFKKFCNITYLEIPLTTTNVEPNVLNCFTKLKMVKCDPKWLNSFISENIEILIIPNGITEIIKNDFIHLTHLKMIYIPESITTIEDNSFENCQELTSARCGIIHLPYLNSMLIKSLILNCNTEYLYRMDLDRFVNLESLILPDTIQYISPYAFINCKKLIDINNEAAKKLLYNSASIDRERSAIFREEFQDWTNLEYLSIPESITEIEEGTFDNCTNIKRLKCDPKWFNIIPKNTIRSILIPNFVSELNIGQFDDFYALSCLELPKHIRIDDSHIFDSCESLVIIKCDEKLFQSLSDKTKNRCIRNKIKDYVAPIYDFQDGNSNISDKTSSISMSCRISRDYNLSEELSISLSNSQSQAVNRETNLDDLALIVPDFEIYKTYIDDALRYSISGEININNSPNTSTLKEISEICGAIIFKIKEVYPIEPRTVQIYTIIRLADDILNKESHGSIGEIKNGEGKSFIITILSIILVMYGRKIDIVTSNINLAMRDQEEQSKYFKLFNISTSVLYKFTNDIDAIMPECNSPKVNDEKERYEFTDDAFKCPVVYSTCQNYEHLYINSLFNPNLFPVSSQFDVVLIDEIDNMFIDETNNPAISLCDIDHPYFKDIFTIVSIMREIKTSEIVETLKKYLPNTSKFNEEDVELLKNAAQIAFKREKNVDYIVENNQIVVIDPSTGRKKKGYRWNNYVHEMVEIKEGIEPKSLSINLSLITQRGYFNSYRKIAGVTGTIGNENDITLLKEGYKVNIFKVPRHLESKTKIIIERRPKTLESLFKAVKEKVESKRRKGRPVLVIWESIENAEKFLEIFPDAQKIVGVDLINEKIAISRAGNSGVVTIATLAAGRGVDIHVDQQSINAGGLHVIIPMNMKNQRSLEQAAGRTGRNGQPGRVTIFVSEDDQYVEPPKFQKRFENLEKIENLFSNYLRYSIPWILDGPKKYTFIAHPIFPFACDYSDALDILARCIKNTIQLAENNKSQIFQDVCYHAVMFAWGIFFTRLSNDDLNVDNWQYCLDKFEYFKQKLNVWIPPEKSFTIDGAIKHITMKLKHEENLKLVIVCGIEISKLALLVVFPEYSLTIHLASGILYDGGLELFNQLKKGEKIDWFAVLICAAGGGVKGLLLNRFCSQKILNHTLLDFASGFLRASAINIPFYFFEEFLSGFLDEIVDENSNEIKIISNSFLIGLTRYGGKISARKIKNNHQPIKRTLPEIKVPQLQINFIKMTMNLAKEAYAGVFTIGRVIRKVKTNDVYIPKLYCLEHNIISNDLYIVMRGSNSDYDWQADFNASEVYKEINGVDYYFHKGFYIAANNVLDNIKDLLNDYQTIYFVGHSYAAGVSCVLSFLTKIDENLKDKNIYAMAYAPPPSMSRVPADIKQNTFIFINRNDMVPHASLYNLSNSVGYSGTKILGHGVMTCLNKKGKTLEECISNLPKDKEELHVRHVHGIIFAIGLSETRQLSDCRIDEFDLPNTISFTFSIWDDHKIENYIESFEIFES